uniref:Uncharacterized protein n=1 Tax=Sphaerodactylus townsendi TaxID=933632 RepID=A0ACB8FXP2_9SAUR
MNQFIPSFFAVLTVEFSCYPREAHSAPIKVQKKYEEVQNIILNPPTPEVNIAAKGSQTICQSSVDCVVIPHRPALAKIVVEGSIAFSFALLIGMVLWCVLNSQKSRLKALGPQIKKYAKKNVFLKQIKKEKEEARKKQTQAKEFDEKGSEEEEEDDDQQEQEKDYPAMKGKEAKEQKGGKHKVKKKMGKLKKIAEHKAVQKGLGKIKKVAKSKAVQKHVGKIKKVAKSKAVQKHIGKIKKAAKSKAIQKHVGKIKKVAKSKGIQKHVGKIKKVANKKAIKKNLGMIMEVHGKVHEKVKKHVKDKWKGKASKKKKKTDDAKNKKSLHRKVPNEEDESD